VNELAKLSQLIVNHFNIRELITVLDDLGINHENLGGGGSLSGLAREAVQYCSRNLRVPELAKALARRKPTVDFSHWGAPLPAEDLHGVLRQLLSEGFSSSDIRTLAFDLLPSLYGEVQSSQSKARGIEIVVEAAIKNNAILQLMEWVHTQNPYQYGKYFGRVDAALTAHQHREPEYTPSVPLTGGQPAPKQSADAAIVLALKMYANGLEDKGTLAKEALALAGY
jgi:hypothetical protein